ncbi:SET domain protein, partial [Aspergillus homomorphus CBS 101889]
DYLGWDGLAIAAYSEAFRRILLDQYYDPVAKRVRDTVLEALRDEISSLVFYGRMRNIDWRGLLLPYSNDNLRHMEDALQLTKKFWDRHPHTVALPAPGRTRPQAAIYEECRQINIEENIFDVRDWTNGNGGPETNGHVPRNPTLRAESNYDLGVCDFCRSSHICRCRVRPDPSELVELVVTEGMGIGVRALWPFRKGDILGEYLGRLLPHDAVEDKTYCLMWEAKTAGTSKQVAIDACFEGNWTRFVNHSCSASTAFKSRTFGDRAAMTLEATRDIAMYEEITVNYGFRYWQHR